MNLKKIESDKTKKYLIHLTPNMARGTNIVLDPNAHVIIAFTCRSLAEFEQAMARGNRTLTNESSGTVVLVPEYKQSV